MAKVLVIAEHREGSIKKASLEVISEGKRLAESMGDQLAVVLIGEELGGLAKQCGAYGADVCYVADQPALKLYAPVAYGKVVCEAREKSQAECILASATSLGRDLTARVGAMLDAGVAADCTGLRLGDGGRLEAVRPVYAGKAYATVAFPGQGVQLATLRPNVFALSAQDEGNAPEQVVLGQTLADSDFTGKTVALETSDAQTVDVTESDVVVSGGRGVKGRDEFKMLRDLAEALGGTVGSSRAAVDSGWIDHQTQVGQTGKTVAPVLYVALGISGQIQHLAGMSTSKYIIAVNKDPEAPIFQHASYGIVGDLFKVVPLLIEEINKSRS